MMAAAATITEEREEIVDLSDQYYNSRRFLTMKHGRDAGHHRDGPARPG